MKILKLCENILKEYREDELCVFLTGAKCNRIIDENSFAPLDTGYPFVFTPILFPSQVKVWKKLKWGSRRPVPALTSLYCSHTTKVVQK